MTGSMDDFLSKPCRETDLLEKIQAHLGLHYCYADEQTAAAVAGAPVAAGQLQGAQLLAELPADSIRLMSAAVANGDKELLDQLILRVEERDLRAARALQEVADRYEYDVLARWFEEATVIPANRQVERI